MRRKNVNKAVSLLVCAALVMGLSSCGKKSEESVADTTTTTTTAQTTTVTTVTSEKETEATTTKKKSTKKKKTKKENYNPLTGLFDIADSSKGRRPVAVMVNNIAESLPQYGISKADIIFEIPAEGGITRLMAIYGDESDIPNVCSVRSARYYFALFAQSFDAVFMHWGIDKKVALPMLGELGIDHIDDSYYGTLFERDPDRSYLALEHTGYLVGSQVMNTIDASGIRSETKDNYNSFFKFYDEFTKPSGDKCTKAVVTFSDWYVSEFNYDKDSKTYKKLHNGSKHMDSKAKKQLAFTNLLILESNEMKVINPGNGLISVDWEGGSGYLCTAGKVQKINWSKDDEFAKLVVTDESGRKVTLNTGKTYIGVTKKGTLSYS
ncbi:MAG: DUF3048 domain-containing protein [Ruminococcus sp.]|nr:DUF3048 domain-containing protein [Ruminococcus sp.]